MKAFDGNWKSFVARTLVFGVVVSAGVFVGMRASRAREGEPGGHTRTFLTVAGTLSGLRPGVTTAHMTFTFANTRTTSARCEVPVAGVAIGSNGGFSAEVDIERCPATLFDGATTNVAVIVRETAAGLPVVTVDARPINPVPYARYSDHYGTPDCPVGFEREVSSDFPAGSETRLCVRVLQQGSVTLRDEVVRVGRGPTAFWIDMYEAGIYHVATGVQLNAATRSGGGATAEIDAVGLLQNGRPPPRLGELPLAVSRQAMPTVNVTWFQAQMACRASGKRLPGGDEWLVAAEGTGDDAECNTSSTGAVAGSAGGRCGSPWGPHDMIGNLAEWTAEWFAGAGNALQRDALTVPISGGVGSVVVPAIRAGTVNEGTTSWPPSYGGDGTWNVAGFSDRGGGGVLGLPAAAQRGGHYNSGALAGIFSLELTHAPSNGGPRIGFRCVIPR